MEEIILFLFADDMILYLKDPKNPQKNCRHHKQFQQGTGYKSIYKFSSFSNTSNEQNEKEFRKIM
jgi:hypothetical protein